MRTAFLLVFLGALAACDEPEPVASRTFALDGVSGWLERASRLYVRGWACDAAQPGAAATVHFAEGGSYLGSAVADWNREAVVGWYCGGSVAHGFKLRTPAALFDGQDHLVSAYFDAGLTQPLPGSPVVFNSSVLYRQEPIWDITFNTGIAGQNYLDPNANAPATADNLYVDKTLMLFDAQGAANPLPPLDRGCLAARTGLAIPAPYAYYQRGLDTSANCTGSVNAIQAYGTSIGISLAPRAVWGDVSRVTGMIASQNLSGEEIPSRAPRMWLTNVGNRIRVEGWFRHPYNKVVPIGSHSVFQEGTSFFYYTLQLRDETHPGLRNRSIWFTVRLFQDKFAPDADFNFLQNTDTAVNVDKLANPAEAIGLIDTILRPSSPRVTPCADSYFFQTTTFTGERKYCFEVSGQQFQSGVRDLNAARLREQVGNLVVFSENPADYALVHVNVNPEVWRPGVLPMDVEMGLSYRDVLIRQIESTTQPPLETSYAGLGALASENQASQWNATDANPATSWTSYSFLTTDNTRNVTFAAYLPGGYARNINQIRITAAQTGGVFESFPESYAVSVTDKNNTYWIPVGTFATQPDVTGVATIKLPVTVATQGVQIRPIKLGTDLWGTPYFRIAEVTTAMVQPLKLTMGLTSNEAALPATNAGDGSLSTYWASQYFASSANDRGVYLAAYHTDPGNRPPPVSAVVLNAYLYRGVPVGFPAAYDLFVTDPTNSVWIFLGNKTTQPDPSGLVTLPLGATYFTHGVMIRPTVIPGHYVDIAELAFALR